MRLEALALLVAAATGSVAQSSSSFSTLVSTNTSTPVPMVVTMTIDDCSSSAPPTMITVTNGVTVTYCPACEMSKSSAAAASATPDVPHTTVYTTDYQSLCTTGSSWYTTPAVYTVTESCTEATPTWASASNYVPPGFTTTVMECPKCQAGPSAGPTGPGGADAGMPSSAPVPLITITMPCECTHTGFMAGPSSPAPVSQISDGQVQAPAPTPAGEPVSQISDGQAQAPAPSPAPSGAPVSQISDGQAQAPAPSSAAPGGAPVSQISDGQAQAPAPSSAAPGGAPVSQISDGQAQAPGTSGSGVTTTARCPGPQCTASTPAASTSPVTYNHASAATSIFVGTWVGVVGGFAAILAGGLAVLL